MPVFMKPGSPFLFDQETGDIVGVKDSDGGEQFFPTSAEFAAQAAAIAAVDERLGAVEPEIAALSEAVALASGSVNIKNYPGTSLNEKWDNFRSTLPAEGNYSIVFPSLTSLEDGAIAHGDGYGWRVTSPLIFDEKEHNGRVHIFAPIVVDAAISCALEFSPVNKTEDVCFTQGVEIDCKNLAANGIKMHGGARVHFLGKTVVKKATGLGVNVYSDMWPIDEPIFEFLEVTDCGSGAKFEGKDGTSPIIGGYVRYLFTNGLKAGAAYAAEIVGKVVGFSIENTLEQTYISAGLSTPSTAIVSVRNNAGGATANVVVGETYANIAAVPAIIVSDATSGAGAKHVNLEIGRQSSVNYTAGAQIQLAWIDSVSIKPQRADENTAKIVEFVSGITRACLSGVDRSRIVWTSTPVKVISDGHHIAVATLADDTAIQIPVGAGTQSGWCTVICANDGNAAWAGFVRNGGALVSVFTGSGVVATTGVLAGTTGTDLKMNVSFSGDSLYIENRLGLSRKFIVEFSTM